MCRIVSDSTTSPSADFTARHFIFCPSRTTSSTVATFLGCEFFCTDKSYPALLRKSTFDQHSQHSQRTPILQHSNNPILHLSWARGSFVSLWRQPPFLDHTEFSVPGFVSGCVPISRHFLVFGTKLVKRAKNDS